MEGQTISLEDGSTAVVQGVSHGKSSGTKFYLKFHPKLMKKSIFWINFNLI